MVRNLFGSYGYPEQPRLPNIMKILFKGGFKGGPQFDPHYVYRREPFDSLWSNFQFGSYKEVFVTKINAVQTSFYYPKINIRFSQ